MWLAGAEPVCGQILLGWEPVWLPLYNYCYFSVPYSFTGPDGPPVAWVGPDCGTCEAYAQGNCACPGAACSTDVLLRLEPGATFEGQWSGGQFVADMLPEACPGMTQCGASCQRAVQAPDGSYSLEVQAGTTPAGRCPWRGPPDEPAALRHSEEARRPPKNLERSLATSPLRRPPEWSVIGPLLASD